MYAVFFAVLAQTGFLRSESGGFLKRPWEVIGTGGLLVTTAIYAFTRMSDYSIFDSFYMPPFNLCLLGAMALVLAGLCVLSVAWWRACHKKWFYPLAFGVAPIFCAVTIMLESSLATFVYFVALGIVVLYTGISERKLGRANLGLLIILACILQKFFAEDFSLTVKAVIFILAGAAFFTFSFYMNGVMRSKGGLK